MSNLHSKVFARVIFRALYENTGTLIPQPHWDTMKAALNFHGWYKPDTSIITRPQILGVHYELHITGFCVSCQRLISFPDGELNPIRILCRHCAGTNCNKVSSLGRFIERDFPAWRGEIQRECINTLIEFNNMKQLNKDN